MEGIKEEIILRPSMAESAYQALSMGRKVEIQNKNVFAFLRFIEKRHEGGLKLTCNINKLNIGWTLVLKDN